MADRCFYFGCWNQAGHYMHGPGDSKERDRLSYYGACHTHVDGTLAPRTPGRWIADRYSVWPLWSGLGSSRDEIANIRSNSAEMDQGLYLRHELDTGFTALSWWDRTQGDERGACNTTVFREGRHTSAEVLAAAERDFPHLFANLTKAGVSLREVTIESRRTSARREGSDG